MSYRALQVTRISHTFPPDAERYGAFLTVSSLTYPTTCCPTYGADRGVAVRGGIDGAGGGEYLAELEPVLGPGLAASDFPASSAMSRNVLEETKRKCCQSVFVGSAVVRSMKILIALLNQTRASSGFPAVMATSPAMMATSPDLLQETK